MGGNRKENAFAACYGFDEGMRCRQTSRERDPFEEDRVFVSGVDGADDVVFIGPETNRQPFLGQVFGQSGTPGTGSNDRDRVDGWHQKISVMVSLARAFGTADYRKASRTCQ